MGLTRTPVNPEGTISEAQPVGGAGLATPAPMRWSEVIRVAVSVRSMRRTVTAALVVGTILTLVNVGPGFSGKVTVALGFKVLLTYLVPWLNATIGVAIGVRDKAR